MLANIPPELRALPHWVCAGESKVPLNPVTGLFADPSNPKSGVSFDDAARANARHVGFILSDEDPFTVIDLDDAFLRKDKTRIIQGDADFPKAVEDTQRQIKIYEGFDTYAERSQSKRGSHIVCYGSIPRAIKRDHVEIYEKEHYIIFTGDVLKSVPIRNCQQELDELFVKMGSLMSDAGDLIEEDPVVEDCVLWRSARNAANKQKFLGLCEGNWQRMQYPSQSEADYALLSILCFYSRSNEQVRRMFRLTALGKREKAEKNDRYLNLSLKRIRRDEAPLVSLSGLVSCNGRVPQSTKEELEGEALRSPLKPANDRISNPYTFPVGLMGEIAQYIYASAPRPVLEVALGAAIGLMAGITGRAYNISNYGLNQYLVLVAKTGRGKEGGASGVDALIAAVREKVPLIERFIGPSSFASGQAFVRVLDNKPCFLSVLGEFGLTLRQLCDANAPAHLVMLKKAILDVYSKSGEKRVLYPTAYSDSDKNTRLIQSPNVTILGDTTPTTFYDRLEISAVAEGLIPRFSIIEYKGKRPPLNPLAHTPPEEALVEALARLAVGAITAEQNNAVTQVERDSEAAALLKRFDAFADRGINADSAEIEAELWNRAHLKALKLSALVAVGVNPLAPVVTLPIAQWAIEFVKREIDDVTRRFSDGTAGDGELKQEFELKRLFEQFIALSDTAKKKARCPEGLVAYQACPYQYLSTRGRRLTCFKNDRKGPTIALKNALAHLVEMNVFEQMGRAQLREQFGTNADVYIPGKAWSEE